MQGSTLLRRVLMWLSVAVAIAGCSFGSEAVDFAFELLDDPRLPERASPVERLDHDARDLLLELFDGPGAR